MQPATESDLTAAGRSRRKSLLIWLVGIALLIGAGALIARLGRSDVGTDAMKTVRAYLSAIRARDVERALEIARPRERPVGQEATFLAAEVLRSDWKIEKLTASDVEESDIEGLPRRQARVAATLTGPGARGS